MAFLQKGCDHALGQIYATPQALKGILGAFRDVLLIDATVLRLHDLLKNCYAACRTNHTKAVAKLHLVFSVLGVSEQKVKLTGERKHESKVWTVGKWVKERKAKVYMKVWKQRWPGTFFPSVLGLYGNLLCQASI